MGNYHFLIHSSSEITEVFLILNSSEHSSSIEILIKAFDYIVNLTAHLTKVLKLTSCLNAPYKSFAMT